MSFTVTSGSISLSAATTSGGGGGGNDLLAIERFRNLNFSTNAHGFAQLTAFIPLNLSDSFLLYDRAGIPEINLVDNGAPVWSGRLEDVAIVNGGVNVGYLGHFRAMSDTPYNALWSVTQNGAWREVRSEDFLDSSTSGSTRAPSKYEISTNYELFIGLKKNEVYAQNTHVGSLTLAKPHNSARDLTTIALEYEHLLPSAQMRFRISTFTDDFNSAATIQDINGAGTAQTGALCLQFTAANRLELGVYNYGAASLTYTGESGANYVSFRNVRVTSNDLAVSTTLSASAAVGASTLTLTNPTGVIAGMWLYLGSSQTQKVTVASIAASTVTLDGLLAASAASGVTVKAQAVYADEIIEDMIATVSTLNADQLSSSVALVEAPQLDLTDEVYEDADMMSIINDLCLKGDNDTPPNIWEAGVYEDKMLYFRERSSAAKTWYVDISELNIQRTIQQLVNSSYPVYQGLNGRTQRGDVDSDSDSIARYGLTRRSSTRVSTTYTPLAITQNDMFIADRKDPIPRSQIVLGADEGIFDAAGARWPKYFVRSGDTVTIRNLPTTLSATIDRIRTFRVSETNYSRDDDVLTLTPESPPASLEVFAARNPNAGATQWVTGTLGQGGYYWIAPTR